MLQQNRASWIIHTVCNLTRSTTCFCRFKYYYVFYYHSNLSQSAISTLDVLLQSKHLQLASAKRVKALILEEIAIDSHGAPLESDLLKEAEQLHLEALKLSKQVFGEMNVQIAKHYGNLGRLYQTMRKYPVIFHTYGSSHN